MSRGQAQFGQRLRVGLAFAILVSAVLLLIITPVGGQLWLLLRDPSEERLAQALPDTAIWVGLSLVGLMVLHTLVPLPAELLAMAAGMMLGPFWGFLVTWIGAILGAFLGFFLARTLGQPFLQYVISPQRLAHWLGRLPHTDVVLLLAIRFLPVISFNLINYALGLSPLGWWRFAWTTGVGIVPVSVFMVVFGAHLRDWRIMALMSVAAILIGIGGYLLLRCRGTALLPWGMSRRL